MYTVKDWANNIITDEEFKTFDDASEHLDRLIDKLYGKDLSDEQYDIERGEYSIDEINN